MGKLREFWCVVASWTLWPALRGIAIAVVISALITVIALIVAGIRYIVD